MKRAPSVSAIWTPILAKRLAMLSSDTKVHGQDGLARHLISRICSGRAIEARRRREHDRCRSCGNPL